MEHPLPEQIEGGSSKHLPFDQLQAIDLPLDLSVTDARREGSTYRCIVAANALRKAFQFGKATVFGLDKPCIQVLVSTFSQHRDKGLVSRW